MELNESVRSFLIYHKKDLENNNLFNVYTDITRLWALSAANHDFNDNLNLLRNFIFHECGIDLNTELENWSYIPEDSFSNMAKSTPDIVLTNSLTIPGNIKSIRPRSFKQTNLKEINFEEGVEFIGYDAFYQARSLTTIRFPNSLQRIASSAFQGCTELQGDLVIPPNVKAIDANAFSETDLTSITITSTNTQLYDHSLTIKSPKSKKYLAKIVLPDNFNCHSNMSSKAIYKPTKIVCSIGSTAAKTAKEVGFNVIEV